MSFFEAVFGIVFVVAVVSGLVAMRVLDHRRESLQFQQKDTGGPTRLDELEERVRVLESIVTDRRFDLKQQIDNL